MSGVPRALVLSAGEELLQGRIADTNAQWLARELLRLGFLVRRFATIGDAPGDLLQFLREQDGAVAVIVSTGGLGPTVDDRARAEAAACAGVPLAEIPGAALALDQLFRARQGRVPPPEYLAQALLPRGARPLANAAGTAWGFAVDLPRGTRYLALPGPPAEMRSAFEDGGGRAALAERSAGAGAVRSLAVHTAGQPESAVELLVRDLLEQSDNPVYGITANADAATVSALARTEPGGEPAEELIARAAATLRARLGDLWWGTDEETLAEVVVRRLAARGETVALAESCTGGRLAAAITGVPGASAVFGAAWVCYANAAKTRDLGVPAALIAQHGAVAEEVACAMATGARARAEADWAIAVTGVAGPDGGTPEKPVGLVWVGVAGPRGAYAVRRVQWGRAGRASIQRQCVRDGLDALRRELDGLPRLPPRP